MASIATMDIPETGTEEHFWRSTDEDRRALSA
jgi:hypothetical protein